MPFGISSFHSFHNICTDVRYPQRNLGKNRSLLETSKGGIKYIIHAIILLYTQIEQVREPTGTSY